MAKISPLRRYAKRINRYLNRLFDRSYLNDLAREHRFVQRSSSQLEGYELIDLVCFELLCIPSMSYEAMVERLQELDPLIHMSVQALSQRINTEQAVSFVKAVFKKVLEVRLSSVCADLDQGLLASFPRVFLQDATKLSLHEHLAEHFKGYGGAASSAGLEMDLLYEIKAQQIYSLSVNQALVLKEDKPDSLAVLEPGDLLIRDLGYFCLDAFKMIAAMGAFFLSRLLPQTKVYVDAHTQESLEIGAYVKAHFAHLSVIELTAYIGQKARLPIRLICYRLPDDIVNKRRREARKNARKTEIAPRRILTDLLSAFISPTWPRLSSPPNRSPLSIG